MSEIQHAFLSSAMHKRKRSENDISGTSTDRGIKRPTTLAIRSPPPSRPASLFGNVPAFSSFSDQLTPVDTSEDESSTYEDIWSNTSGLPDPTDSATSSVSASSIKVQISFPSNQHRYTENAVDTEMDVTPSTPIRPRIGRARSNDILPSPPRYNTPHRPALLSPDTHAVFPHDRIPTPITGHFDLRLDNLPSAPRHSFPPIHTNLSPMIEQDTWGSLNDRSYYNLPSTAENADNPMCSRENSQTDYADIVMDYGHTSSSMSGLRVSDEDDVMETEDGAHVLPQRQQGPACSHHQGPARNGSFQAGRTARLHMGFLAGCEKCAQKVPGHYSHILRS